MRGCWALLPLLALDYTCAFRALVPCSSSHISQIHQHKRPSTVIAYANPEEESEKKLNPKRRLSILHRKLQSITEVGGVGGVVQVVLLQVIRVGSEYFICKQYYLLLVIDFAQNRFRINLTLYQPSRSFANIINNNSTCKSMD